MLLHRNKRKSRDFLSSQPSQRKIFTTSNKGEPVTWNPGLYDLHRFDVPLPINKRRRELDEGSDGSKENQLDELSEDLIRPLKKLHITPKNTNQTSQSSPRSPAFIQQSGTVGKTPHPDPPAEGDTNPEFKKSGNRKKVSLIEFLYNDNEDDFPRRQAVSEKDGKKTFKVPKSICSWIGNLLSKDFSQNPKEPSTALTVYEHPFNTLQRRWLQYLHMLRNSPEWEETYDPYPSQIKVEEVDEEEDQLEDQKETKSNGDCPKPIEEKLDRCLLEGCEERPKGEGDGSGWFLDKNDCVEVDWKDVCHNGGGSWFQKNMMFPPLNGKFEVAQKGA